MKTRKMVVLSAYQKIQAAKRDNERCLLKRIRQFQVEMIAKGYCNGLYNPSYALCSASWMNALNRLEAKGKVKLVYWTCGHKNKDYWSVRGYATSDWRIPKGCGIK